MRLFFCCTPARTWEADPRIWQPPRIYATKIQELIAVETSQKKTKKHYTNKATRRRKNYDPHNSWTLKCIQTTAETWHWGLLEEEKWVDIQESARVTERQVFFRTSTTEHESYLAMESKEQVIAAKDQSNNIHNAKIATDSLDPYNKIAKNQIEHNSENYDYQKQVKQFTLQLLPFPRCIKWRHDYAEN